MVQVLDYSAGQAGALAIARAGYAGAVRYIGLPGRTKDTTRGELDDFSRNGRAMALVFEETADNWRGGRAAGQRDAQRARDHANAVNFPSWRPIYMAIDRDVVSPADFVAAMEYLRGAQGPLGGRDLTGVYGEHDVVKRALEGGYARYGWQTAAWSGGKHYPGAHLYQRIGTVYVGGIACDVNDILAADWGQHNYVGTVADVSSNRGDTMLIQGGPNKFYTQALGDGAGKTNLDAVTAGHSPEIARFVVSDKVWDDLEHRTTAMDAVPGKLDAIAAQLTAIQGAITSEQAAILAAISALPTGGQPSAEQMDALATQLKASLGPAVADELGRRLQS